MKLLGWFHRKIQQCSCEPLKDFTVGKPLMADQQYSPRPNCCSSPISKAQRDDHLRKSFIGIETALVEEELQVKEEEFSLSDIFRGFFTMGTHGIDQLITEPPTPTFTISVEKLTENELELINDELEKVLGVESKDDTCSDSGRSSYASTITLSDKSMEETDGNSTNICPLQNYLFGSAIGLPETTTMTEKQQRATLGELFQRTKITEENNGEKCYGREKETDTAAAHPMKKMMKKSMLQSSSWKTSEACGCCSSASKLHKIIQMFHRKVHPENSTASTKSCEHHIKEIRSNSTNEVPGEEMTVFSANAQSKECIKHLIVQTSPPQVTHSGTHSNGNGEHWIKTDAEYLVLEL